MLIILFGGIIIFLSDKSRPNRVRTEGIGANWGMRCCDRAAPSGSVSPSGPALTALSRQQEFRLCGMKINHGILFFFVVWLFPFKKFDHCRNKAVTAFGSAVMGELTMWQQQTKFRDLKSIQKQFRTLFWHDEVIAVNSSHFSPLQLSLSQVQLNEQKILSKLLNYCQLPHRQAGNSLRLLDSLSIFGCIRRTRENLRNKIVPWARKNIRSTITKKIIVNYKR